MDTFDKYLSIYPGINALEALACIRDHISECKKEPRRIGVDGGILYIMKSNGQVLFVYQTKTQYVVRQG